MHLEVLDLGDIEADVGEQRGEWVNRYRAVDQANAGNILESQILKQPKNLRKRNAVAANKMSKVIT